MPYKAMISHRGEKYEIGRGKRFYGIWAVGAPYEAPIDRWPESRDGWEQAWTRFAAIETPGTIGTVSQGRIRPRFSLGRGGPTPGNPAVGGGACGPVAGDTAVLRDTAETADTAVVLESTAEESTAEESTAEESTAEESTAEESTPEDTAAEESTAEDTAVVETAVAATGDGDAETTGAAPVGTAPPYGAYGAYGVPYGAVPYGAVPPAAGRGPAAGGAVVADRRLTALLAGEGLLVLGVVLGLAGLFPTYVGSQSLLSQGDQVVPHLCYVVAWAASAGVIALGVARPGMAKLGALFSLGLSAVTFGLFLADLGQVISGGAALGTGLVVSMLGWLACTAGSWFALRAASHDAAAAKAGYITDPGRPWLAGYGQPRPQPRPRFGVARPDRGHVGPLALLVLAGTGTAAAFAPSWDSYTLATASTGTTQTITAGNAFDNPGLMIAGNVAVMVAVVAVAALAALWRPARQGALLLAGAIVPLAAQAVSALIQVSRPASAAMFGISRTQASAAGLTISSGVTSIFWVYCVFVIALLISCAWLFTAPGHPAMPAMTGMPAGPWPPIAGGDQARGTVVGEPGSEDADSDGAEGGEHSAYA